MLIGRIYIYIYIWTIKRIGNVARGCFELKHNGSEVLGEPDFNSNSLILGFKV